MSLSVTAATSIALYVVYVAAGLQQLLFAYVEAGWKDDFYFITFTSSVCCLALGNITHAAAVFGWQPTFITMFGAFLCIVYFEELGLATGAVFGEYRFTKEMGPFISPNLPALVPVLWCGVLYPSFLIAARTIGPLVNPSRRLTHAASSVFLSAAVLTGFDIMCEPVSTIFGHQVWHHVAFVNTDISTYVKKPDWLFLNLHERVLFLDIPVQNAVGWFVVGSLCYCWMYYTFGMSRQGSRNALNSARFGCVFMALPPCIALLCTAVFYLAYPPHPRGVRIVAAVYIFVLLVLLKSGYTEAVKLPKKSK